jgi:hypothetical protein
VGEKQNKSFQLCFNGFLKVDFQGSRVTSDGGLILVRELDEHMGMNQLIEQHLTDPRGTNCRLPLADLLRQSVYSRLAVYEDVNDAERVSRDPTFRLIGSAKIWDRGAALTSRLQSFETELLAEPENLAGLSAINRELIAWFQWLGWNSGRARFKAQERLRACLEKNLEAAPNAQHFVIAHSHGGNIAIRAVASPRLQTQIRGIACLSTPFISVSKETNSVFLTARPFSPAASLLAAIQSDMVSS